jgi:hypothetical protein
MKLSYSKASTMNTCGKQYHLKYILGARPPETSINLPMGNAIHIPCTEYVSAHALSEPFDIMSRFEEAWHELTDGKTLKFSAKWDLQSCYDTSKRLVEQFPEVWEKSQLIAVLDQFGVPIVERRFTVPGPIGTEIELVVDFVTMDLRSGAVGVLDLKSAAAAHQRYFGMNSLQLSTYQYGVDWAFGKVIGPVENVGFMEAIKRKVPTGKRGIGPTIEPPTWYERRTPEKIREMLEAYAAIARDIREKRFTVPFQGSFNSPCNLCDFAPLCVDNDPQGFEFRNPARQVTYPHTPMR